MSDFAIIFQVLAGVLALAFIYLTYMNTKTWRWVHVTFMFLVFAATLVFTYYAAATLKTRAAWIGYADKLDKQIAQLQVQVEAATRGNPLDPETKSMLTLGEELGRTILDRGRVWRGCTLTNVNPQAATMTLATVPPPDPNLPEPAAPPKNLIADKTILHAFREAPPTADGSPPPFPYAAYIGEFQATAVTDQSVTLAPTMPLSQQQFQAATARVPTGPPTWTLYEVCPVDGHEWFKGMDETALRDLIPMRETGLPQNEYDKLIQSYVRDGEPADLMTDPPENIWVAVMFLQPYELPVDAATVASIDGEPFNTQGQAVFDRLRKAGTKVEPASIQFGPTPAADGAEIVHQTALLLQSAAQPLIDQGICKPLEDKRIFRRRLTDYDRKLNSLHRRQVEFALRQRQREGDLQATQATTEKAHAQAMLLEDLKGKLNHDLEKGKFELAELSKYADALSTRLNELLTKLSELYRSNKALSRELTETSARLTEEIERRQREATARLP
jgi:hypothetical protein